MEASQVSMEAYGVCAAPQSRRELQFARFNLRYGPAGTSGDCLVVFPTPLSTPTADLEVMVVRIDPRFRSGCWGRSMVGFDGEQCRNG